MGVVMRRFLFCREAAFLAAVLLLVGLAAALPAQEQGPRQVFVQSFRKGPTRVAEQSFVASVNTDSPTFKAAVKDAAGNDRYEVLLEPHRISEEDPRILAWRVRLIDRRRAYIGNLLMATPPPALPSDTAKDNAWVLDPGPYAPVPLLTQRVFKVEDFYCILRVKDHHLLTAGRWLVDSMKVEMDFTQTQPAGE